jgi:hypothetical protein
MLVQLRGRWYRAGVGEFPTGSSAAVHIHRVPRLWDGPVTDGLDGMMPLPTVDGDVPRHCCRGGSKLAVMGNLISRAATKPTAHALRARRPVRQRVISGLVAVLVVSATACSDDDTAAGDDNDTGTTVASTTTTQPPANDEASHEVVEELVVEATELADELFQDPTAVDDPDNEALARLREIYTEDSPTPDGVEEQLRDFVASGQHQRPAANGIFREVSVYAFEAVDSDTLAFDTCNQIDKETVDADGEVVGTDARVVFVGGEAHRVDGAWRFVGLSNDTSRSNPIAPGTAEQGLCAQLAAEAPERGQQ